MHHDLDTDFDFLLGERERTRRARGRGPTYQVLFLGGNAGPTAGSDADVMANLQARFGAENVEYIQGSASLPSDMNGKQLGIISSTLASASVRGKFDTNPVPQLIWEEALFQNTAGEYCMSSSSAKPVTSDIRVVDETHPIMVEAGLSNGIVTIGGSSTRSCPQGVFPAGASVLAELPADATCAQVLACEIGAVSGCGTFPGRRANFPTEDNNFTTLNADGLRLWDAILSWLLGII